MRDVTGRHDNGSCRLAGVSMKVQLNNVELVHLLIHTGFT